MPSSTVDLDKLEVSPIVKKLYPLSLRRIAAIAFAAAVVLGGAGLAADTIAVHRLAAQYDEVPATIVDEPTFAYGKGKYGYPVVAATVQTEAGQRIHTAVDEQAHTGDTIVVHRHRDTGKLYRATTAGATPITAPGFIWFGIIAAIAAGAALCAATAYADWRVEKTRDIRMFGHSADHW